MNRDELLTKLAMELPEWPIDMPPPNLPGLWSCHHEWRCQARGDAKKIFGHDWLQRRAELINEPPDSEAPEWARWKAQDGDGEWFWYSDKPSTRGRYWQHYHGYVCNDTTGKIPAGHDWTQTLREVKRDMSQNEPVESRNEPHGITGVKHRVDRQLNPPTSKLTNSKAREFAEEFKTCSDGQPCGQDDYCDDCPNEPHKQDARRLDDQLANDMRQQCNDNINPSHYRQGGIECIDAIKAATVGKTGIEAACVANVIKYLWRYEEKNGVEDIEKALWYINRLHDEVHD